MEAGMGSLRLGAGAALGVAAAGLFAFERAARADEVVLLNGRKVRGTIVSEDDKLVVVRVDGLGDMKVARSDVREIVRKAPAAPAPAAPETPKPEEKPAADERPAASPPAAPERDPLAMRRDFHFEKAPLRRRFESIAEQAGLVAKATPAGEAMFDAYTTILPASHRVMTLADALRVLVRTTSAGVLRFGVHDGVLEAGKGCEVDGERSKPRGGALVWADRRGDATGPLGGMFDPRDLVHPDLVETTIEGRGGALEIRLRFADDVVATLGRKLRDGRFRGHRLVEIWIDADDDAKTGRPMTHDSERTGWERKACVEVGFRATLPDGRTTQQSGEVVSVPAQHSVTGFFATYEAVDAGSSFVTGRFDSPEDADKRTTIRGAEVVASVPYAELGVASGRRVRVAVVDLQQESSTPMRTSAPGGLVLE
jgi:hypothetical protein